MKLLTTISALALVASVSACSQPEAPAENASAGNDMTQLALNDPSPFTDSEMKMNQAMIAAVGVNSSDSWVRKMIEHHRGAVDMSRIALASGVTGDVAKMAQTTIDKQGKEITALQKLVAAGAPSPASAELYRPASMKMHADMMESKGADVSETYLRKMLAHHRGAVAISDVALANGATGPVRVQIEKTKASQQMEVGMVEAMLRGDPMKTAGPAPAKPEAANATEDPTTTAEPAAPKKMSNPKTAVPAADPHAGMDMNNM